MTRLIYTIGCAITCIALSGCSAIPGMQMGAMSEPNPAALPQYDVFPIDVNTIQRLADEGVAQAKDRHAAGAPSNGSTEHYRYRIGAQDILRVTVWDHPELNNPGAITNGASALPSASSTTSTTILGTPSADSSSRIVSDDGTIFYPYVGVVKVEGKTPDEVRRFLTERLASTIRAPQVEVVVASFRSKRAYITGEIKNPGVLPITDVPLNVTDAIGAAGGLNLDADLGSVTLTRGNQVLPVDLFALLYQGDLSQNLPLQNGDALYVPEQRFNKVFVLGEVVKPSSLLMPRGIYTLNEALADVGGANQNTAQASQIYVIRRSGGLNRLTVFHLNAQQPDALVLADSFQLKSRDIIFVDAAAIVRFNRIISQILPSLQALQAGKYIGQ